MQIWGIIKMPCGTKTEQTIPCGSYGADAKSVSIRCGSTGYLGTQVLCPKCEQQGASSPKFQEECPLDQEDIGNEMFDAEGNVLNVNR